MGCRESKRRELTTGLLKHVLARWVKGPAEEGVELTVEARMLVR